MNILTRHIAQVLSPELEKKLSEFRHYMGINLAGFSQDVVEWHGVVPEGWAEFPHIPSKRSRVYTGRSDTFSYSHHHSICKFKERYVVAWSNGLAHEDAAGQEPHYAWSDDAATWSSDRVIVHTDPASGLIRNLGGLFADDNYLYAFVGTATPAGVAEPGMTSNITKKNRLDLYRTSDLESWEEHLGVVDDFYLFEGPRLTREGKLLCCGINEFNHDEALILIWDDPSDPTTSPRRILVSGAEEGVRPQQGTWYQTDDGRIWIWQRDGGHLTRLGLTWSDDGGDTWNPIVSTNFQNTYSRAHAGRLNDGRFYIIGNNFEQYLNRLYMHVAVSDDGAVFDRMYTLLQGPTTRRIPGRHKEDGYHYPNSIVDGDNLLVTYSVNKEDIEVAVVDTNKFE